MWKDPIVEEVDQIREKLAAEFDFDVKAIFADLRKRQLSMGVTLVPQKKRAERSAGVDHARTSGSSGLPSSGETAPAA
jgi:hypothetical protein